MTQKAEDLFNCSKKSLIEQLESFYKEFCLLEYGGWSISDINHFLLIKFHLVKGHVTKAHQDYIAKLLEEIGDTDED